MHPRWPFVRAEIAHDRRIGEAKPRAERAVVIAALRVAVQYVTANRSSGARVEPPCTSGSRGLGEDRVRRFRDPVREPERARGFARIAGATDVSEMNPYAPPQAPVAPEQSVPEGGEPARAVQWFLAGFLDFAIVYVVGAVATIPVALAGDAMFPGVWRGGGAEGLFAFVRAYTIAGGAVFLLYYPLLECSALQATFGKRLLGVRLSVAGGRRLTFVRALGRHLAHVGLVLATLVVFPVLPLIVFAVNAGMLAFGSRRQTLHDMLAGVRLVRVPRRARVAPA